MTHFRSLTLVVSFLFASFAFGHENLIDVRPAEWAVPLEVKGLSNLHRVTPMLYRSAQPDAASGDTLRKLGIKTVLSFRKRNKDEPLHKTAGVTFKRYPLYTWDIEEKDIIEVLRIIDNPDNQPILVHCTHGADRTGLMMASYRMIVQGWSKEAAIAEMKQGKYEYHVIWKNIEHRIRKMDIEKMQAEFYGTKK
ncbi:MAG: tyrosine-protein phosphatase [Arenimonas sp.]